MIPNLNAFKAYFKYCNSKDICPSFEHFIIKHQKFIRNHCNKHDPQEHNNWYSWFKQSASEQEIDATKGDSRKVWKALIERTPPTRSISKKRTLYTSNVVEVLESLSKMRSKKMLVFEEVDVEEKLSDYFDKCISHFKSTEQKVMSANLNKLLTIQRILKLDKPIDIELEEEFNLQYLSRLRIHLNNRFFGKQKKLSASLKNEIADAFEAFQEDYDDDELESKLNKMKKNRVGAEKRTINSLIHLLSHMTLKNNTSGEMRLQSGIVPAVCQLFKLSLAYGPQGYDQVLFSDAESVRRCRPDFVVEVDEGQPYINMVGGIKGSGASSDSLSLDTYRLALFGLQMLWSNNLKHSMVFQVVGQKMKFFMCSLLGEMCLMSEVGSLILPVTYDEYALFSNQSDTLFDMTVLYEEYCKKDTTQAKETWQLLDYDVVKTMFDIGTGNNSTVAEKTSSSTEDCL